MIKNDIHTALLLTGNKNTNTTLSPPADVPMQELYCAWVAPDKNCLDKKAFPLSLV